MTDIYLRHWECKEPRAVIILVHGLGEFCERYDWAASQWVARGYAVIGGDFPGHGKSGGKRGHIRKFDNLFEPLRQQLALAAEAYPNVPQVLFGHSLGGLTVVRFLQTQTLPETISAAILSSPCLQFAFDVPSGQLRMLKTINKVWPTLLQPTNIEPSDVSRSPETQTFYQTNSLILHKVSVRLLSEFYDAMEQSRSSHNPFRIPMLIAQAGKDKLANPAATEAYAKTLDGPHDFLFYPHCHHELLNEPERADIFQEMAQWLDSVMSQSST